MEVIIYNITVTIQLLAVYEKLSYISTVILHLLYKAKLLSFLKLNSAN